VARGMVIVGTGQAGVQAAEALRAGGYTGPVTLLGDEPHPPYHRPPLSKAWLAGEADAAQLTLRAPAALARRNIELRSGSRAMRLDRAERRVELDDGSSFDYEGLVLATGSRPRALALPGGDAAGVLALRSLDDAHAMAGKLRECAATGLPLVVIGGGFIGLEVAATARKLGVAVTVLEAGPRLLGRVLAPMLSEWYAALHAERGVELVFEAQVEMIETAHGAAAGVRLRDGSLYPAGLVVVGIGVQANDALARDAGLACDRGIVVDACARTSDPHVAAAGDCTARRLEDGRLLRLESVHNAVEQGRSAAAALLGQERPFVAPPWFWSDQYEMKLQIAGLSPGADEYVVRGDMASASFSVYHLHAKRLIAVDSVNAPKDHMLARKLLEASVAPDPARIADAAFDLADLLPA
jgi:3-phenylpropionate/trans-cinnamate dioxygenase ferredoxin reductase component